MSDMANPVHPSGEPPTTSPIPSTEEEAEEKLPIEEKPSGRPTEPDLEGSVKAGKLLFTMRLEVNSGGEKGFLKISFPISRIRGYGNVEEKLNAFIKNRPDKEAAKREFFDLLLGNRLSF